MIDMIQFIRKKEELLMPRTLEYSSFMFIKMFLYINMLDISVNALIFTSTVTNHVSAN